jgi:type II secretory pathway pseudopilin PulG
VSDHFRREAILMWIIPGAILVIGIISAFLGIVMFPAYPGAEESARRALFAEVCARLADYHNQHQSYPASLSQLSLTFPDGSTPKSLQNFQYSHSKAAANVTVEAPSSRQVLSCTVPPVS